jgi:hypothetical protein
VERKDKDQPEGFLSIRSDPSDNENPFNKGFRNRDDTGSQNAIIPFQEMTPNFPEL